jgi:hydroxymethylpyrimidine pyrophosphatase-like HAD family hydrolase
VWSAVAGQVLAHAATRYVVASDGAVVMDVQDAESPRRLHLSALGRERSLALYERVRELPVTFDAFWDGKIYVSRRRFELMRGFDIPPYDRDVYLCYRTPVDMSTPRLLESLPNVERLTIFTGDDDARACAIEAVAADPTLHYTYSGARNLEVMDAGTSKGTAVRWLCDHLGIPRVQSVGFGDSPNDLTMLAAVGDGVAVANAYPEAKAAATHVAPWTCDESAVARYLEPLL